MIVMLLLMRRLRRCERARMWFKEGTEGGQVVAGLNERRFGTGPSEDELGSAGGVRVAHG